MRSRMCWVCPRLSPYGVHTSRRPFCPACINECEAAVLLQRAPRGLLPLRRRQRRRRVTGEEAAPRLRPRATGSNLTARSTERAKSYLARQAGVTRRAPNATPTWNAKDLAGRRRFAERTPWPAKSMAFLPPPSRAGGFASVAGGGVSAGLAHPPDQRRKMCEYRRAFAGVDDPAYTAPTRRGERREAQMRAPEIVNLNSY